MLDTKPIYNLQPHYTDQRFAKPQTVWVADGVDINREGYVEDCEYNYSDRIWQWDWNKADAAQKSIDKELDRRSPAYIQEFLRVYFENPAIVLVHVMAGFNVSNGFAYQVYGYSTGK